MNRPKISRLNTWSRREKEILSVLDVALSSLQSGEHHDRPENDINWDLNKAIRLEIARKKLAYTIFSEACNQPLLDQERDMVRERKKPDIQISWTNPQAEHETEYQREYIIECKRLGLPLKNWIFNQKYVSNGVQRFITEEHGYAKGVTSGTIVGYVQSMDVDDIVYEVNNTLASARLPQIHFSKSSWKKYGINNCDQKINRPQVPPIEFELQHIWIDFRKQAMPT